MDRRVALQSRVSTPNAYNEPIYTYATYVTVWGEKIELSVEELLMSQQISAQTMVRVRIYYRAELSNTGRAIMDGQTYEMAGIQEIGRRDFSLITLKAVQS